MNEQQTTEIFEKLTQAVSTLTDKVYQLNSNNQVALNSIATELANIRIIKERADLRQQALFERNHRIDNRREQERADRNNRLTGIYATDQASLNGRTIGRSQLEQNIRQNRLTSTQDAYSRGLAGGLRLPDIDLAEGRRALLEMLQVPPAEHATPAIATPQPDMNDRKIDPNL